LTEADVDLLGLLCDLWARWFALRAWLAEHGTTYTARDKKGGIRFIAAFPEVAQERALYQDILRIAAHFGMTPSSRSEVQPVSTPADDPLADFINEAP